MNSILPLVGLVLLVLVLYKRYLTPPPGHPSSIPTIPIYINVYAIVKGLGHNEVYERFLREPLQKHGAVNIYLSSRWNVLFQRSSYIQELLKREDIYTKSGNNHKIPYGVLADLLGDNIITATGENWRLYTRVIAPAFNRDYELGPIRDEAKEMVDTFLGHQRVVGTKGVAVNPTIQRFAIDVFGKIVYGIDFKTSETLNSPVDAFTTQIKSSIFKPLYMTFAVLDKLPIPSRLRIRKVVKQYEEELLRICLRSPSQSDGTVLSQMKTALKEGTWSKKQFTDNLKLLFIAGHENVQNQLNNIIYALAIHPGVQERLRRELSERISENAEFAGLLEMPYLTATIYECLRLYPAIAQLINRKATQDVFFCGEFKVPNGTYLGWNAFACHRDPEIWKNALDFNPDRWGQTTEEIDNFHRSAVSKAYFIPFNAYRRACIARSLSMLEMKVALTELILRCKWKLEEGLEVKFTSISAFTPKNLRVVFEEI